MTPLTASDFAHAANVLGCEEAAIRAVSDVESAGDGFLPSGRLVVKFEGHIFYKYTQGAFAKTHPTLCYPRWTEAHSRRGEAAWLRLDQAIALNRRAALLSTSFGRFQVMGFNHAACGFADVERFVANLASGEPAQLQAFIRYIIHRKLADALKAKDWAAFAKGYNGPAYAENQYDRKMATAYAAHARLAA